MRKEIECEAKNCKNKIFIETELTEIPNLCDDCREKIFGSFGFKKYYLNGDDKLEL